jgi:glycosyltransferase involved in cell wall biosynthesis
VSTAYNESDNLYDLFRLIEEIRLHFGFCFPAIIVDNESKDGSYEKMREIASQSRGYSVVKNSDSMGYGDGVRFGLENSESEMTLVLPSDLQYSAADCISVIDTYLANSSNEASPSVLTFRRQRLDSKYNRVRGFIWRHFCCWILKIPRNYDPASQLKLIPTMVGLKCESHNFIWDIESTYTIVSNYNSNLVVDVCLYQRTKGKSTLSASIFVAEFRALKSLLSLRRRLTTYH